MVTSFDSFYTSEGEEGEEEEEGEKEGEKEEENNK